MLLNMVVLRGVSLYTLSDRTKDAEKNSQIKREARSNNEGLDARMGATAKQ